MQAILQSEFGAADVLRWSRVARPQPQGTQLCVRVLASGVNRADIVQREGRYPPPVGESEILGLEVAGIVEAVGERVTRFSVGEAVFGLVGGGGYAEVALLEEACAVRKPETLSWVQAAACTEVWATAWLNLVEIAAVQPGEHVLIHAGASGVGSVAIQLAKRLGARVSVTVGSAEKAQFCCDLGADCALNYRDNGFERDFLALSPVNVVLDPVGGTYLSHHMRVLAPDGRLVLIGVMGGAKATIDLARVLVKRIKILGSTLRALPVAKKSELIQCVAENIVPELIAGRLKIPIARCFGLSDAAEAHRYLESHANCGKVVLTHDGADGK